MISLRLRLQRYARSLPQNADVADDLVQETLLHAWKAEAQFAPDTGLSAWTFAILRNLFLTARRRDRFHGAYDEVSSFSYCSPANSKAGRGTPAGQMTVLDCARRRIDSVVSKVRLPILMASSPPDFISA